MAVTEASVWSALERVMDPEVPKLSVVDLGMIQEVRIEDGQVHVAMTPTFAGCPATAMIQEAIRREISALDAQDVAVELRFDPPWSSNRITSEGRRKLKDFGLAPPPVYSGELNLRLMDTIRCPFCGSEDTSLDTPFGPTLCRAIYICHNCHQPFELFKPL